MYEDITKLVAWKTKSLVENACIEELELTIVVSVELFIVLFFQYFEITNYI